MKSPVKSNIAKKKPRDKFGHFVNPDRGNSITKEFFNLNPESILLNFKNVIFVIIILCALLISYDLGKLNSSCSTNHITKIGIIYSLKPYNKTGFKNQINAFIESIFNKNTNAQNRYILIDKDNSVTALESKEKIGYESYFSRQVFATGSYTTCDQTMKLTNSDSIQLVP